MAKKSVERESPSTPEAPESLSARAERVRRGVAAQAEAARWRGVRELQRNVAGLLQQAKLAVKVIDAFAAAHEADLTAAVAWAQGDEIQRLHFGEGGNFHARILAAGETWTGWLKIIAKELAYPELSTRQVLVKWIDTVKALDPERLAARPWLEDVLRRPYDGLPAALATVETLAGHAEWRVGYAAMVAEVERGAARPREGSWSLPPLPEQYRPSPPPGPVSVLGDTDADPWMRPPGA